VSIIEVDSSKQATVYFDDQPPGTYKNNTRKNRIHQNPVEAISKPSPLKVRDLGQAGSRPTLKPGTQSKGLGSEHSEEIGPEMRF